MVDVSRGTNVNVSLKKTLTETVTSNDDYCNLRSDDAVKSSIQSDFVTVLEDIMIETLWLIRTTETQDSSGKVDSYVETKICAPGRIIPLSEKERTLDGIGTIVTGDMIGYFEPTYDNFGTDYEVTEGDQITRNSGVNFRVQKILHRQTLGDTVIYIKTLLRRLK